MSDTFKDKESDTFSRVGVGQNKKKEQKGKFIALSEDGRNTEEK